MSNKVECRLPPINTLALEFPLLLPQPSIGGNRHTHGLLSPLLAAQSITQAPFIALSHGLVSGPSGNLYNQAFLPPAIYTSSGQQTPPFSGLQPVPTAGNYTGLAEYTHQLKPTAYGGVSPLSAAFAAQNGFPGIAPSQASFAPLIQQPLPSNSRRLLLPSPLADTKNGFKRPSFGGETACPECHLYFLNLATHKLTHLNPTARPHVCDVCNRGFARPNDLFRHHKCHWKETGTDSGQFRCPFKAGNADQCSHSLGIFSRCDTYKNHLKAIHFDYPGGTRKSERATSAGRCALCQKQFVTVDEWLTTHVDTRLCEHMK
ncbi:hypothetical protein HF325_002567 [Metschnikowia pulcherrima]|uniref:C2H2-type domain-containing protein n=1 Tax=Metschnikowia pulcherrima TaxID=27326 RepID=A0A8H7GVA9_9ASCO|nr:hypothetical protein HF325_002567 [Metschnikowia pulcherrima]